MSIIRNRLPMPASVTGWLRKVGLEVGDGDLDVIDGTVEASNFPLWNGRGETFFVSRNAGSSSYDGKSAEEPKATIQDGVDAATDWRGDTVVLMCDASSSTSQQVSTALACDCPGLTIRGLNLVNPLNPEQNMIYYKSGSSYDGTAVTITQPTIFYGITFGSAASGTYPIVNIDGTNGSFSGSFNAFINCRFVNWSAAPYMVQLYGSACNHFVNCQFEDFAGGVTYGVHLRGDDDYSQGANYNQFIGCHFVGCAYAFGVEGSSTANDTLIKECTVIDGKLLDSNGRGNGLICGNYLETSTDTGSYDATVDTLNGYGWNMSGNNYAE